jgi:hypothetical protein
VLTVLSTGNKTRYNHNDAHDVHIVIKVYNYISFKKQGIQLHKGVPSVNREARGHELEKHILHHKVY